MIPEQIFNERDLVAIYRLRVEAWSTRMNVENTFPDGKWIDTYDANALHWGIKKDMNIIASARLNMSTNADDLPYGAEIKDYITDHMKPFYMLSRLVVAPSARNNGYSNLLDKVRLQAVVNHGCGTAFVITSNNIRIIKLLNLGFTQLSASGSINTFPGGRSTLFSINYSDIQL